MSENVRVWKYAFAVLVTAAAVAVRWALDPVMGNTLPLVTLFGAVAAATWVGGYRAALVVVVLGYLACAYLFIEPYRGFAFGDPRNLAGVLAYLVTCGVIVGFGDGLRQSLRRSHDAADRAAEQHERLRTTLASIGDAVISTDTAARITMMNPVAESLTGWTSSAAVGQPVDSVFRIINEKTRLPVDNPVHRVLQLGRIVGLANHTTLIAKDGTERPISDSAAPITCADDQIVGCVLVFRDVTEQRRAERAARFLASIVESSDAAIIGKDINGIVTSWNAAAERLFGYTAAEAVGQPIGMLAPPDRPDEMPQILERIRHGERIQHFDTARRTKDGRLVPISLTVSPIKDEDGEIIGASKICTDISERKRAAEALREEKARLQATLTSIGDAVIVTDADGRITLLNGVAQRLTGWDESATGRPLEEVFRIVNEHTRRPVESPVRRVLCEGTIVGLANHTVLITRDGSEHPIDDSAAPIVDAQGDVVGCVLVFRDITERRQTERRIYGLMLELQESDRRKDEFLATLSHELRGPLAPLRNMLEIIKRAGVDTEIVGRARDTMERQLDHMVRLVDDLLDVSRITRNKLELRKERVELEAIVQQSVEACGTLAAEAHLDLRVALPQEPIYLDADPARLTQVFNNLLSNACKYTEAGGKIWLNAERQGDQVLVRVRDTGIGIPADKLAGVFDMFSQVQSALDRSQGGLGIGLTLVRQLVEMHGGSVAVASEGAGKGAEFTVRLPCAAGDVSQQYDPELSAPTAAAPQRILVVDDNRDSAESLAMLLQFSGHHIATAHDGEEAVEMARRFGPDMILLDLGLPKLNGFEAARRIRQQPWGRNMLLVALTGWGQDRDRALSKEAGFDHHLVKPVDYATLMELLAARRPERNR